MDKREEQFLNDLIAIRMEEHHKRKIRDGKGKDPLLDVVYMAEQEKKYKMLAAELTEDQREIFEGYV